MKVAVIGAGLNGLAAARAIARAGHDVTVIERFALGHPRGSSHGPVRIFRTAYEDAAWVARARAALPLWAELEAEVGERLLHPMPCVNVGPGLDDLGRAMAGVPHEIIDGRDAQLRFPAMRFDAGESVLIEPDAAVIDAEATLRALASSARAHGARITERRRVLGIVDRPAHVEIVCEDGAETADVAVVAAGSWVADLVPDAVPQVRPSAETVLYAPVDGAPPIIIERGAPIKYALPVLDGTMRAGFSRGDVAAHPDDDDAVADESAAEETWAWLHGRLRLHVARPTLVQRCMYTMTPDESFVLERRGKVVIASACSGHGFKFAPLTGAQVAELVNA